MKKVVVLILSLIVAVNVVSVDVDPSNSCSTNSFFEMDIIDYE